MDITSFISLLSYFILQYKKTLRLKHCVQEHSKRN